MRPEYEKGEQESDEREDGGSGKKDSVVFKNPVLSADSREFIYKIQKERKLKLWR